jgi:O-antigen ligase
MGNEVRLGADGLWRTLRLPRTDTGALDQREVLRLIGVAAPAFIALWGVFWLSNEGIATDRADLIVALATAIPLWIAAKAWRLPWWLHVGAASLPLSVGIVALAHADPAGLVRGTKFAYGVILLLGVAAWARSARRRVLLAVMTAAVVTNGFFVSLSRWYALADGPFTLMKGTVDWHNQFAGEMLSGLALGIVIAVLGRGGWAVAGGVCAALCGAGVLLSGSRYGFILGSAAAVVALLLAIVVARLQRRLVPVVALICVVVGATLLSVFFRSRVFFPEADGSGNVLDSMIRRGGLEYSTGTRLEWWLAAWKIGIEHPLSGAGHLTFEEWSGRYGALAHWHPHNEWAFAWAEGGIVALAPLVLLGVGAVALVLQAVRPSGIVSSVVADPARWGALLALVLAVAHLVIEYDLYYTILVALLALAAGIATGAGVRIPERRDGWRGAVGVIASAAVGLVAVAGLALDPTFEALPWV